MRPRPHDQNRQRASPGGFFAPRLRCAQLDNAPTPVPLPIAAASAAMPAQNLDALPLKSEAPLYDVYRIMPKGTVNVFVSQVAPTQELGGLVRRKGGAGDIPVGRYVNEGSLRRYAEPEQAFARFRIEAAGGESPGLRKLRGET